MKHTANSNKHLKVIEACLDGFKQVDMARELGCSNATVSRIVNLDAVREQVEILRAAAMANAWERFQSLLDQSLKVLETTLTSPLVERNLRARVALKIFEAGLAAGITPRHGSEAEAIPGSDQL